ncbi:hypothetical protein HHK36_010848 [Tetracentron sinense]|uniref:Tetraspanin-3 n=1 Tax=Tetracentron sinense TaxID=13715 RepID=A0A834ZCM3_TETSI|nr:hypothetical protein HHK36_010848 [Tetracentron sinense]
MIKIGTKTEQKNASRAMFGLANFKIFIFTLVFGIVLIIRASRNCTRSLQWPLPLIILGVFLLLISVVGFFGSYDHGSFLLRLYLYVMFFIITALVAFIVFAYVVTAKGSGRSELNRAYRDYYLADYSGWLEERVSGSHWRKISSCIRDHSKVCKKMTRGVGETADMFFLRTLKPIESGCCKPPTECGFVYVNETTWDTGGGFVGSSNMDCTRWSNDQQQLCYSCDSCKAGVLASLKKSWRKVSYIYILVVVFLVIAYLGGWNSLNIQLENKK